MNDATFKWGDSTELQLHSLCCFMGELDYYYHTHDKVFYKALDAHNPYFTISFNTAVRLHNNVEFYAHSYGWIPSYKMFNFFSRYTPYYLVRANAARIVERVKLQRKRNRGQEQAVAGEKFSIINNCNAVSFCHELYYEEFKDMLTEKDNG